MNILDIIFLVFLIVFFIGAKFHFKDVNDEYISRRQTQCINGFFVLIVFIQHFKGYVKLGDYDMIYNNIANWSGQLLVVPFLFFSGYGIMLSISKKGKPYVNSIILKRFPKIWTHFALAIVLFIITNFIIGKTFPPTKLILTFIGWDGIGNSNWYIFDTLVLYILTFLSFRFVGTNRRLGLFIMALLTSAFVIAMSHFKPGYWYNTVIAYLLGMIFATIEPSFKKIMSSGILNYIILTTFGIIIISLAVKDKAKLTSYEVFVIAGIVLLLALSLKVRFSNPIIEFLGKYVFEIYILQRIPMILLKPYIPQKYIFFAVSFIATIIFAFLFRFIEKPVDKLIDGQLFKKAKPLPDEKNC